MITPNTRIILLKSPITLSNKHQITFASKEAQFNYFYNLTKLEEDDCSYQRKDNVIRFPAHFDALQEYNYCMYQNENYGNKWFYAFITNMNYVNDNCTYITIKTDVFQTWQFDLTWKKSFIEREHVLDDTIGLHTIQENLDVGEVFCQEELEDISYTVENNFWIAISCDWQPDDNSYAVAGDHHGQEFTGISVYNNQVFGNKIFLIEVNDINNSGFINAGLFIKRVNTDGHIGDLHDIFIVPDALINRSTLTSHTAYATSNTDYPFTFYTTSFTKNIQNFKTSLTKNYDYGITIKNNKCYCYPYNYLFVSNNNGSQNIYKYEDFATVGCIFDNNLAMCIGISGNLVPCNYKGESVNNDESLPLGKYPTCGWSADSYINWLTQNAVNIPSKFAFSQFQNYQKFSSGDVVGATVGELQEVSNLIGGFYSASLMPNVEGSGNNGNIIFATNKMCFTFKKMRSKNEYIKIIDEYFSLYGYKVNELKLPNLTNRTNWNYIKTVGANILANIPQLDLAEIKEMFDNGITLWHNTSTFLDYSQNNN